MAKSLGGISGYAVLAHAVTPGGKPVPPGPKPKPPPKGGLGTGGIVALALFIPLIVVGLGVCWYVGVAWCGCWGEGV
jgi:hypothetical protein